MNGSNSACSLGNTIAVIAFLAAIGYELQARLIHLKVPIYEPHLESTSRLFFTSEFYMENTWRGGPMATLIDKESWLTEDCYRVA